jgi:hypothetical protein
VQDSRVNPREQTTRISPIVVVRFTVLLSYSHRGAATAQVLFIWVYRVAGHIPSGGSLADLYGVCMGPVVALELRVEGRRESLWLLLDFIHPVHTSLLKITHTTSDSV